MRRHQIGSIWREIVGAARYGAHVRLRDRVRVADI
jgi:hypothetical protein